MTPINPNDILFRCSAIGKIMTNGRGKDSLGETAKATCIERMINYKYEVEKPEIDSKYICKGTLAEEDAITLLSRYMKTLYSKNSERLNNGFVTGEPDIFTGASIKEADLIIDIKSSYDIFTFWNAKTKENTDYLWQLQGYMWLTGAKKAMLAYCLVNAPDGVIDKELQNLYYHNERMGKEASQEEIDKLIKRLKPDYIPLEERIYIVNYNRNETDIQAIQKRVIECRYFIESIMQEQFPQEVVKVAS